MKKYLPKNLRLQKLPRFEDFLPHILESLKALNASSLEVLNLVLEFCRHKNLQSRYKVLETFRPLKASSGAEMEYCASPASMSMLAEEILEIAE